MKRKIKLIGMISILTLLAFSFSACSMSNFFGSKDDDILVYSGTAEAEEYNITTETAGKIKELKVEEGQAINEGDVIAVIDTSEASLKLKQSEIGLKNAENELGKVNEGSRSEEINAQRAVVSQAEAVVAQGEVAFKQAINNVSSQQTNYDYRLKLYNDKKDAPNNSAGTEEQVNTLKNAVDNAKTTLENAKLSVSNASAQLNGFKAQLDGAKQRLKLLVGGVSDKAKTGAKLGVDSASKNVELSKIALSKGSIASSASGTIETINFKQGEYVTPGNPIATLLDLNSMYVKIYIPEKILPSLKLNQEVSMKSDFIKDKVIRGKITYISPEAEFTPMNIVTKKDRMKLVFAVKVKIVDNVNEIKPGMLMDINIK